MPEFLTDEQWWEYEQQGYLRLGPVVDDSQLQALRQRMDDIMLGRVRYESLQLQLDTGGAYEDLPDPVAGLAEVTLGYRKIQGLEVDPLMLSVIQQHLFREICAYHYGRHASISIFRAMMMNKPAGQGTYLPWHQDAGDVWKLDRDPLVTIWIALDPARRANGCVQIVPGSHKLGLLSKNGSTISASHAQTYCTESSIVDLEVEAGEGLLLHNWLLHRSGINETIAPRRALTACYMDGRTLSTLTGNPFPIVFGSVEPSDATLPFVRALRDENQQLRHLVAEAERYAKSLVESLQQREDLRREVEVYAKSLEVELARVRAAGSADLPASARHSGRELRPGSPK